MPAALSSNVVGQVLGHSRDHKHKQPHCYHPLFQSNSESSSLYDVEDDPNDSVVKMILKKERKAKNQQRYYHQ